MKPVCLITGAGGLLGNHLCESLKNDYQVIGTYRKSVPKSTSQLVGMIDFQKPDDHLTENIYCIQADLTKREDIRRLVDVSLAKFGRIDIVINNAVDGMTRGKLLELYQLDDYASPKYMVNSIVPFLLVSYLHDNCWKDEPKANHTWNRNVINVSSIAGVKVYSSSEAFYSASKAALNMLTLHLAAELTAYSVRVNSVCPGGFADVNYRNNVVSKIKSLIEGSTTGQIITAF